MHEAEQLTAVVQETTFRNEDNGYTVLRVGTGRAQQTVVGVMPELSPGENVTFEGYWTEHPVYGRQFSASSCAITPPTGKSAIEKYLGSGLIRGIGPATAKLIVARFGERALDILDEQPQRLTELPGIGPKKAAMIAESYLQQMGMRRALVFLQNYGISPTLAMRIAKYYGEDTVELVRENPYRMVLDVEGVGFLTADRMALSMGIDPQSDFRIRAALFYLMGEAAVNGGHTYLPREMLLERACKMLRAEAELVDRQIAQGLLQKMLMGFSLPDCEQALCLPLYFHAEQEIALRLAQLMRARPYKRVAGLDKRIAQYERELGVRFDALQKRAITSAVEEGVLVVTGGPGTGKTTIIRCIISLLKAENEILLCAPTGRAAKRMSEATGEEARTIHRMLRLDESDPIVVSEKVVRRIMREGAMRPVYLKRPKRWSSYAGEIGEAPANLVERDFHADAPNMLWVTDVTQFTMDGYKCWLSPVVDCFDGMVVSWTLSRSPNADMANRMLLDAVATLRDGEHPIIHSDRGCHYRWDEWIRICEEHGLIRSMSAKGCSPDNAAAEGFFGRLKNELFYGRDWRGVGYEEFRERLAAYLTHYNETRIKKSLDWMSPVQYRRSLGLAA